MHGHLPWGLTALTVSVFLSQATTKRESCFSTQGAAVSSELTSQYSLCNIAALECPIPPRRVLKDWVWLFSASQLLYTLKLIHQNAPEISLERLITMVDYLSACKFLPNVS